MEEKKRFRPTLTAYRSLEKELANVNEEYRLQLLADKHLAEEMKELKSLNVTLEQSNKLMFDEIKKVKLDYLNLEKINYDLRNEIGCLKSRSWLERLFNL